MTQNRAWRGAALAFLVTLGAGAAFINVVEQRRAEARKSSAIQIGAARGRLLESRLNAALSRAEALALLVRQDQPGAPLDSFVAELRRSSGSILSLQLAPGGIIDRIDSSDAPIGPPGFEVLKDPDLGRTAAVAVQTKRPCLAGPVPLKRRGTAMVALLPVFLQGAEGEERFWGLVIASVGLRELIQESDLDHLQEEGYHYHLSGMTTANRRAIVLARSTELELAQPVNISIPVPGGEWTLSVSPVSGWRSDSAIGSGAVLVLVFSLLVAFSAFGLMKEPETLRQEVESRRRRLSEATRQLKDEFTQRQLAEERLRYDASHDALTDLPNRPYFTEQVQKGIELARQVGIVFAVLFLDIDHFKYVNEGFGQSAGDRLLQGIALRLRECLRPGDVLARVGGDELAALLLEIDGPEAATSVTKRMLNALTSPFQVEGQEIFATGTIGVALSRPEYRRAEELLSAADTAAHWGKARGRNCCVLFDDTMHADAVSKLRMESDLRRAIEREEFVVFYQPIVSLATGQISGCEALVRWRHPTRGLVSPVEFIPAAEECGLIIYIDRWVLSQAVRQVRSWRDPAAGGAPLCVSVNLSGRQLAQPHLVDYVAETLGAAQLEASRLKLEVTESVVMENAEVAEELLVLLSAMGVNLMVDDFGTGYSSLSYIQRFPFSSVKIDRSFIIGGGEVAKNSQIVLTIVNLARNLGMDVIAEGVETALQADWLREMKCGFAQGYFFSRPLDAQAMELLLASRKTENSIIAPGASGLQE